MKTKKLLLIMLLGLMQINLYAQTNVGGTLSSNTVWSLEGSPYNLVSTLGVPTGKILTIEPGVHVTGNFDLLVKGTIIANGNEDGKIYFETTRLIFKSANLDNSELSYMFFDNGGVQLADENEFNEDDPKNDGTLLIENSVFTNNAYVRTKGYHEDLEGNGFIPPADLIIENSTFTNSDIIGYYPRSETITINNSEITNCLIHSQSFNFGINFNGTNIKNSELMMGCCDANFSFESSTVENSNISEDMDNPADGDMKILNSIFINTPIDLPAAKFTVINSIIENYNDIVSIKMGNGLIENTSFLSGNNATSLYITGYAGYDLWRDTQVLNSMFATASKAIEVSNFFTLEIEGCNFNNINDYAIYNTSSKNFSASNNWWGTTETEEIEELIYDMYDNINSGIVDYSNYLLLPNTAAPISPPVNVFISAVDNGVQITWDQNIESDLAGYKIYYNRIDAFSFENVVDVGNVTSYTISGLDLSDAVVVTAYDIDADGNSDQLQGHESWYSFSGDLFFSASLVYGNTYCFGEEVEVEVNVFADYESDNTFVIELSDENGNFENAVLLYEIETTISFNTIVSIPDSFDFGMPYSIRVRSTNPEAYSENMDFIVNPSPTSSFTLDVEQLCGQEVATISYTGNATENATYMWDFDGGNIISGSGQGNYEVSWDTPGNKVISLLVFENGCFSNSSSSAILVYTPDSDFYLDEVVCENSNTTIEFMGYASDLASFEWSFDDANIVSGAGAGPYVVNWDETGTRIVTLTINDNGCVSATTEKSIDHNPIPTVSIEAPEHICFQGVATISGIVSAPESSYFNWNFDGGTVISGSGSGPYEVSWANEGNKTIFLEVDDGGCSASDNSFLTVNPQTQPNPICMVTVNESNKNMIVWEVPDVNPYASVVIYKESSQSDVYIVIGTQSVNEPTFFTDENSNPSQNSSRYKLAVIDTCGYETNLSDFHKTIHLTINAGMEGAWNLLWDKYEGFDYSTVQIYRGTSDGNLTMIAEQASNTFTYTDLTPPSGTVYYQIAVVNPNPCNVNLKTNDYFVTRSNIINSQEATSVSDIELNNIKIFPNPVSDMLYIELESSETKNKLIISSVDGRVLLTKEIERGTTQIDMSDFTEGVYIIQLNSGIDSIRRKIVKQ